jgi:ribose transport system substrate-binding protein
MVVKSCLVAVCVALIAAVAAGCGNSGNDSSSSSGSTSSSSSGGEASSSGKPTVVLSNNFMGNPWRQQMVKSAEVIASRPQFKDKANFEVKISEETPTGQIASLQQIIREKPAVITLESSSPTALNPTLQQACSQGIDVIVFDQKATAPCAFHLNFDAKAYAEDQFRWLAAELKDKGKIVVDNGLAGTSAHEDMTETWEEMAGSSEYPDMEIVGNYDSEFADGPESQGVSQIASQEPNIDGVLTIWSCRAVGQALEKSGIKGTPVACNLTNGNAKYCIEKNLKCFLYGGPPFVGGMATEKAIEIALGNEEFEEGGEEVAFETNYFSPAGEIEFEHKQELEPLEKGVSLFPESADTLTTPVTYDEWEITPEEVE